MTWSFSSGGSRPCRTPSAQPGQLALGQRGGQLEHRDRRPARLGASPSASSRSSSRRRGRPDPRPATRRRRRRCAGRPRRPGGRGPPPPGSAPRSGPGSAARSAAGTTWVAIGWRPAGSSVSVEMSRSPNTVMATVRGIGVAVMTSRCGGPSPALSRSASRCSTPNLCCSSITTRPRSANCTFSSSSAWVPITMPGRRPTRPPAAPGGGAAAPSDPVSSATLVACSAPPSMPAWRQRRRACR